ncbi:NADH-quinone oxidoreductase subunit 5 family protein [Actinomarinicola tropica]|uniref:NADH-quinone oxidoreductase subunit L n=1 Tax=Actinomarinicola tropica TaxID=2789776 RepID=A0A5Q2RG91_9ACTN|nr:NADH-quinone oxidoreductase subunit L [Actinomarinicola tropica]QGG93822.1 NADH-quinone oxidoreductase subunit L [Actinomarinicola tropica]
MWFLENAWIIPAIPAASFLLILFFGKRMPRGGSEIGIAAVGLSFLLSVGAGVSWIDRVENPPPADDHGTEEVEHEEDAEEHAAGDLVVVGPTESAAEAGEEERHAVEPVTRSWTWWQSGGTEFQVGTFVDGLSVMMLFVVGLISLLVHVYSTEYVKGDRRFTHFFAFLSLFTASMMTLVISENTLQIITAWEAVGVCSFALIGHWWEDKANGDAALKAFLTNRVGDVGLIIGMITLYFAADSFNIVEINSLASAGELSHTALLVASLCLIAAVMSKSGQFFLHTWLPDAMAGPTPVSALLHSATMVVAGIFMVGRMYGVFWEGLSIGTSTINALAVVGGITTLVGASLAFVQRDIKKVLAYSTISQLGYMAMALGVGAWTAALFHLFTHAFFKACLFLGAGSVSHACHHSFDMVKDMGGLRKYMPHTFRTFMIGSIALAGIPPLAGFWSKDEILAGAQQLGDGGYTLMLVMGLVTAGLTGAYVTRMVYLTFFGEYRGHGTPHESPKAITTPLWILAGFAALAGGLNLPDAIVPESVALQFEHYVEPTAAYFPDISHPSFSWGLAIGSTLIAAAGIALSYSYWFLGKFHGLTERNALAMRGYRLLENKYYLDVLYTDVIVGSVKGPIARASNWVNQNLIDAVPNTVGRTTVQVGRGAYRYVDQAVVDGAVNLSGRSAEASGSGLRLAQTGRVRQYGSLMFGGAAILAAVLVVIV